MPANETHVFHDNTMKEIVRLSPEGAVLIHAEATVPELSRVINTLATRWAPNTAISAVLAERFRQDAKWGEQNHDLCLYLTILGEEYGETCQAVLDAKWKGASMDKVREEAVQTAAVALAIVECIDRKKWRWSEPPSSTSEMHL